MVNLFYVLVMFSHYRRIVCVLIHWLTDQLIDLFVDNRRNGKRLWGREGDYAREVRRRWCRIRHSTYQAVHWCAVFRRRSSGMPSRQLTTGLHKLRCNRLGRDARYGASRTPTTLIDRHTKWWFWTSFVLAGEGGCPFISMRIRASSV